EVNAPRREECNNGIHIFLCAGLREINLVVIRRSTRSAKSISSCIRYREDVLDVVLRSENRRVCIYGRLFDSGNPVDACLLSILMNMFDQRLYIGKCGCIGDRTTVRVKTALPARIDIDVLKSMRLNARGSQGI